MKVVYAKAPSSPRSGQEAYIGYSDDVSHEVTTMATGTLYGVVLAFRAAASIARTVAAYGQARVKGKIKTELREGPE